MKSLALLTIVAVAASAPAADLWMCSNNGIQRIVTLSPQDGSLVDQNFITMSGVSASVVARCATQIDDKIYMSVPLNNVVQVYSLDGQLENTISVASPNGIRYINGEVYVCSGGTPKQVIRMTKSGVVLGSFTTADSPMDVIQVGNELRVSVYNASQTANISAIQRFSLTGTDLGALFTNLAGPQQIQPLANGNLLIGCFVNTSTRTSGIYEITPAGALAAGTPNPFAIGWRVRGVALLENGKYLMTKSDGIFQYDRATDLETQVTTGSGHFVNRIQYTNYAITANNPAIAGADRQRKVFVEIRNTSTGAVVASFTKDGGTGPTHMIMGRTFAPAGNYDIAVRSEGTLWRILRNQPVNLTNDLLGTASLLAGNIVADDIIDIADYVQLSGAFSQTNGDANWSTPNGAGIAPRDCDITNDGIVDIADYIVLAQNFGASGDL